MGASRHFRAMHRHDADLVGALLHLALDLALAGLEPVHETGKRGAVLLLVIERAVEQRIDGIIGLAASRETKRSRAWARTPERNSKGRARRARAMSGFRSRAAEAKGSPSLACRLCQSVRRSAIGGDGEKIILAEGLRQDRALQARRPGRGRPPA